jgi:hypothetical protein
VWGIIGKDSNVKLENRKMFPKEVNVIKWILQFLLSSFLAFVVIYYLNPRGGMGTQVQFIMFRLPFAVTAGIILGDIPLYITKKFCVAAVIASLILSVLGFIFFLFLLDTRHIDNAPVIIGFIVNYAVLVLPSLVGYNCFSYLKRREG